MKHREKYLELIDKMASNPKVSRMNQYIQHGNVTTLDHVKAVSRMSFWLNDHLHANARTDVLLYGSMLHDYYLYDWHHHDGRLHGFSHPKAAMALATADFQLPDGTEHVIRAHMWPLTLFHMPLSREAWLVTAADKLVALNETIRKRG